MEQRTWIKVKVKEYYEDDPRSCSTEYRKITALMCPHCKKKFYPVTAHLSTASYCPACGEVLKNGGIY